MRMMQKIQLLDVMISAWCKEKAEAAIVGLEAQHAIERILHLRLAGIFTFLAAAACNLALKYRRDQIVVRRYLGVKQRICHAYISLVVGVRAADTRLSKLFGKFCRRKIRSVLFAGVEALDEVNLA